MQVLCLSRIFAADVCGQSALRRSLRARCRTSWLSSILQWGQRPAGVGNPSRQLQLRPWPLRAAAKELVDQVRQLVPSLQRPSGDRKPSGSRITGHATAFMTMAMLAFALNVPVRLAITDRPICFYDEDVAPRSPIDVSRLPRGGRSTWFILMNFLSACPGPRGAFAACSMRRSLSRSRWPGRRGRRRLATADERAAMLDRLEAHSRRARRRRLPSP